MSFIEIEGNNVYYELSGKGQSLILIHGFGSSHRCWKANIDALTPHFKVCAIDLIGFGDSGKPKDYEYNVENFAQIVKGLMEKLKIKSASIIGHSMGGRTAACFALRYPQHTKKIVIVGSPIGYFKPPLSMRLMNMPLLSDIMYAIRSKWAMKPMIEKLVVDTVTEVIDSFLIEWTEDSMKMPKEVGLKAMNDLMKTSYTDKLAEIKAPALIIFGDNDNAVSITESDVLQSGIPGSRLEILEGAGHGVMFEKPERFNQLVLEFLK